MTQAVTKKEVEKIVNNAVDDLSAVIQTLAQDMHQQLFEVNQRMNKLEASIDRLTNTIDKFYARIDTQEIEMLARDAQFERLLAWARKVSKKTGIPLENL